MFLEEYLQIDVLYRSDAQLRRVYWAALVT
jgi:hypothetical protein